MTTLAIYTLCQFRLVLEVVNLLRGRSSRTVVEAVSEAQWLIMSWNAPEYGSSRVALRVGT